MTNPPITPRNQSRTGTGYTYDLPKRDDSVAEGPAPPLGSGLRPPSASRSRGLDELDCRGGVPGDVRVFSWWCRVLGQGR